MFVVFTISYGGILLDLPSIAEIEKSIGIPFSNWERQCHVISLAFVKADFLPPCRVARGKAKGMFSQHSWVVIGDDCYDEEAEIVDPTLWSYDDSVEGIWQGTLQDGIHHPHGEGRIWEYGAPPLAEGKVLELAVPVSRDAQQFLELCGPLDYKGWAFLAHAPIRGWPAKEIVTAMMQTETLGVIVPIDIVGMVTDLNPSNLYLKDTK